MRATIRIPRLGVWFADLAVDVAEMISGQMTLGRRSRRSPANRVDGVVDLSLTTPAADVALGATEVPVLDTSNPVWTEVWTLRDRGGFVEDWADKSPSRSRESPIRSASRTP